MSRARQAGDKIGNYRLLEKIGEGGFGEVWKAEHTLLPGKLQAFKFPHREESAQNFLKEAKLLSTLNHPQLVKINDISLASGETYLKMDYEPSPTLREILSNNKKIPWPRTVTIIQQIATVLQHLHQHNTSHQDLKPSNIFILPNDEVKISDLGLAGEMQHQEVQLSGCLQENSLPAGTWSYMSPEQKQGKISPGNDIYSLGVIWYEMLTGYLPTQLDPPSHFTPECSEWIDETLRKMLRPEQSRISLGKLQETLELNAEGTQQNIGIASQLFYQMVFLAGLFFIVISWVAIRVPPALIVLTLLGITLIEISRRKLYRFWPTFLFWGGVFLTFLLLRVPFLALFSLLLTIVALWWLTRKPTPAETPEQS